MHTLYDLQHSLKGALGLQRESHKLLEALLTIPGFSAAMDTMMAILMSLLVLRELKLWMKLLRSHLRDSVAFFVYQLLLGRKM